LDGGAGGCDAIAGLLDAGRTAVRPGGWLALELDCARSAHCAWLAGAFGWTDVAIHADLFGRERFLLARRSDAP
jgi:release factor glutamine methyltransferase